MNPLTRLGYALRLAIVSAAIIGLIITIASADVIGLIPIRVFDAMLNPIYFLFLYVVAFLLAPLVSERFPISRSKK